MELAFENRELRSVCEDSNCAKEAFGEQVSIVLQNRIADLRAATSIKDLIVGRPGVLNNGQIPNFKIDLCDGFQLIFCANHVKNPLNESGELNWLKVRNIRILEIGKVNE